MVKTDLNGTIQWNQTYGGGMNDWASNLLQIQNEGYVLAGGTESYDTNSQNMWLVKIDFNGTIQWNKTYDNKDSYACDLILTSEGGLALLGWAGSGSNIPQDGEMWLVKTDINGTIKWNHSYSRSYSDFGSALLQTTDGSFLLTGGTDLYGLSGDMWLIKTDVNGSIDWDEVYGGGGGIECAYDGIQTPEGDIVLAGLTLAEGFPSMDVLLVKTDNNGTHQWNQTFGGPATDWAISLIQTTDNGLALAGRTTSLGEEDEDMWLIKTDMDGQIRWNQTYGDTPQTNQMTNTESTGASSTGQTETITFTSSTLDTTSSTTTPWMTGSLLFLSLIYLYFRRK